jgi:hypothetical protein
MIVSLWSLFPWCGIQEDPAEARARSLHARNSASGSKSKGLISRTGAEGSGAGLLKRSVDLRAGQIGASSQTKPDLEPQLTKNPS